MDDLIRRQDAIEAIEGIDWYSQDDNKEMTEGAYEVDEAWYKAKNIYETLEHLPPAAKTGRWTPMSEKPPTEKKKYLATIKHNKEVDIFFWNGKTWIRRIAEYRTDEIEAWMPLPNPYEGDE